MLRYKLNQKGFDEIKDFVTQTGSVDYLDCYLNEAESIASHAFKEGLPAILTIEHFSGEYDATLPLPNNWFTEVQNNAG